MLNPDKELNMARKTIYLFPTITYMVMIVAILFTAYASVKVNQSRKQIQEANKRLDKVLESMK